MAITAGYFIVDGRFYEYPPSQFAPITDEAFGVRDRQYSVFDGKRLTITEGAQEDDPATYAHKRKVHYQAWRIGWDGRSTLADFTLFHQLKHLYETQTPFWVQYDDEMSREFGRCLAVGHDLLDPALPSPYFTPTWPIFPRGFVPGTTIVNDFEDENFSWAGHLLVGSQVWEREFSVNQEFGIVVIEPSTVRFDHRVKVHFKYTWMAYVRIREFNLRVDRIAQEHYIGDIVCEQVRIPVGGAPLTWRDTPYWGSCVINFNPNIIKTVGKIHVIGQVTASKDIIKTAKVFAQIRVRQTGRPSPVVLDGSIKYATVFAQVSATGAIAAGSYGQDTQVLRPASNVGEQTWPAHPEGTEVWDAIRDPSVNDADYIVNGGGEAYVQLDPGFDPGTNADHRIVIRMQSLLAMSTTYDVGIYQGSTLIANKSTVTSNTTLQTVELPLTTDEAALITDYTNLQMKISASLPAIVTMAELHVPTGVTIRTGTVTGQITARADVYAARAVAYATVVGIVQVIGLVYASAGNTGGSGGSGEGEV